MFLNSLQMVVPWRVYLRFNEQVAAQVPITDLLPAGRNLDRGGVTVASESGRNASSVRAFRSHIYRTKKILGQLS